MTNVSKTHVGVDISKKTLDIHILSIGKSFKIKNGKSDIGRMIKGLAEYKAVQVTCEATGGYEKLLIQLLKRHNVSFWIVDPRRIKGSIIASGCKSKTDKIDAKKIAEFAAKNAKDYEPFSRTENQEKLLALVNRKEDLTKVLAAEKTRLKHPSHASSSKSIKKMIRFLEGEIKTINKQIQALIQKNDGLNNESNILESIPGIGKASAAGLISWVPELGKISISALVGVCPYDNQSGKYKGKKFIRGGRAAPRKILYMCALTTIKYNLVFKEFYDRLIAKGKPFKVAIVAVMHKLIILANSLLRRGELCAA